MEIKEKILCVDHKNGVYKVDPAGKDSYTIVKHMFYDEETDESVVECRLITGRTHQIRVHLSYIGHPIANDICYGGQCSSPPTVPDAYYKLRFGDQVVKLEKTAQLEIYLCSYRYILTQNLDFSAPQPPWAQKPSPQNT
jgi:23S rRNA-/tRNA-specific pseudouridylate synthase